MGSEADNRARTRLLPVGACLFSLVAASGCLTEHDAEARDVPRALGIADPFCAELDECGALADACAEHPECREAIDAQFVVGESGRTTSIVALIAEAELLGDLDRTHRRSEVSRCRDPAGGRQLQLRPRDD